MEYIVLNDISLRKYNTLRLDVRAAVVVFPYTVSGLVSALRDYKEQHIVLIGNGSNMFFSKSEYDEQTVFIVSTLCNDIVLHENQLVVESGVSLNQLAWFACENSIAGYAFCEDIPGTMGGALFMNAGQWKYTIGQYVKWIEVYDLEKNETLTLYPDEDFFKYRYSKISTMKVIVLRCALEVKPGEYLEVLDEMLKYRRERYVKQPRNYPNAGSVFKRPKDKNGEDLFVWKLFDETGLRGYRIGDAMISEKHPGFIVNVGQANVQDITLLIQEAVRRVKENFDVELELEWRVI